MTPRVFRRMPESILMLLAFASASAATELKPRSGFIECGGSQIRALAECYARSDYCTTETLSFGRRSGRAIMPLHPHRSERVLDGKSISALDYVAKSWACVPGKTAGRYLVVVLGTANGGSCTECEYSRLYDINGRLIAADLTFDRERRPRDNPAGRQTMRDLLGSGRHVFSDVYR